MCGICGAIDLGEPLGAESLVRKMNESMIHRGPDDEGYLSADSISLAMRRLSIIDLEGGHQPIFNEDGSIGVVLNGEIYNFQDVQQQLKALGHKFRTRSDSEVVAHAYEEWGSTFVQRLEGMFAIAIYDSRLANGNGPRLFLVRDPLGIK